jgi:hypothetical protein
MLKNSVNSIFLRWVVKDILKGNRKIIQQPHIGSSLEIQETKNP